MNLARCERFKIGSFGNLNKSATLHIADVLSAFAFIDINTCGQCAVGP